MADTISSVVQDGVPVPKGDFRAFVDGYIPQVKDSVDIVRSSNLTTLRLIWVAELARLYRRVAGSGLEDDGDSVLVDAAGNRWHATGGADGIDGDQIFVQDAEPTTGAPGGSIWIDSDSADNDLYVLTGSPLSWVDTGVNLKGLDGSAGTAAQVSYDDGNSPPVYANVQEALDAVLGGAAATGENILINGGFDVWQRGTMLSADTGKRRLADRWEINSAVTTVALSREKFTEGQTDVPGEPAFYHRFVVSADNAADSHARFRQNVEDVRTLAGETATISFWAKADAAREVTLWCVQSFGTGTEVLNIGIQKFSLTTSWQKFTHTFSVPSISGQTIGTPPGQISALLVHLWLDAGSDFDTFSDTLGHQSGTFDFASMKLEKGSVATDFEKRPIALEMALCRRYYQKRRFRLTDSTDAELRRANVIEAGAMQRSPVATLTPAGGSGGTIGVMTALDLNGPSGGVDVRVLQQNAHSAPAEAVVELDAEIA